MARGHFRLAITLSFLMSCLLFVGFSSRGEDTDAKTRAILDLINSQQVSWNQGDVRAFMEGYWKSPELTFSGSRGVTRGWEPVLANYLKTYPNREAMGRVDFSELEVRILGTDAALVLGKWHITRAEGDIGGVFTLVFRHFPEGWRIIHDHTSTVPAAK